MLPLRSRAHGPAFWLVSVLFASGCNETSGPPDDTLQANERRTEEGVVRGFRQEETFAFLGIPYAAPPVGNLRFRPPVPPASWSTPREATSFATPCAQAHGDDVIGSEDCLALNVWQPAAASAMPRPVMVWLHGGDNVSGSTGGEAWFGGVAYDGSALAAREDVIVVSVAYRLGAFGFLHHQAFAEENDRHAAGNWALMDQLAALEWVHRNIANFGGDPANVTLFGQSAGADDTCALIASPRSHGLVHRAIMMSPGGCHTNDERVTTRTTDSTIEAVGCSGDAHLTDCLRDAPVDALANAPQMGAPLNPDRIDFYVTIDGWLLTETPLETFRRGGQDAIPVIFGTTSLEYGQIFAQRFTTEPTEAQYEPLLGVLFGAPLQARVVAEYPLSTWHRPLVGLVAAHGDAVHHCSVRAAARALAAQGRAPVFRYIFDHVMTDSRLRPFGASHGYDLPFVFRNSVTLSFDEGERTLTDAMSDSFARFARTGDPNAPGAVEWPRFDVEGDRYAIANTPWQTLTGARAEACDFWDALWAE